MAGGSARSSYPREITELSFFFNCFTDSDEAAEYVMQHDRGPGTFLLRPSTRSPTALTLTISISDNNVRHVQVQHMDDLNSPSGRRYFIIIERSFSSFHDLYAYYTDHIITNLEQIDNVRLLNPLDRSEVADQSSDSLPENEEVSLIPMDLEIPPLPKKLERNSGLTEVPLERQLERSLDSAGEDNRTSSSSNGSGTQGTMVDTMPELGAVGGEGVSLHHAHSVPTRGSSAVSMTPRTSWSSGNIHIIDFQSPSDLTPVPQSDGGANFYLGPQQWTSPDASPTGSVPLPFLPQRTPKEDKQHRRWMEKQQKKEEKQKQKEEKQKLKEESKKKKEEERKKKNQKALSDLGWCRPPLPLPTPLPPQEDEPPYYSTPRPYRDHLEELKTMLRESEICDCGLRMMDAELADGWTVHRSREQATYMRVFYQHENGNTTWMFPTSIANLISVRQVQFILNLCQQAHIEEPQILRNRFQALQHPEGYYPQRQAASGMYHARSNTSMSSNRSRTSSASSGHGVGEPSLSPQGSSASLGRNRSASLDQRLPMPPPEGQRL